MGSSGFAANLVNDFDLVQFGSQFCVCLVLRQLGSI